MRDHAIDLMGREITLTAHHAEASQDRHRSAPNVLMSETSFDMGASNPILPPPPVTKPAAALTHADNNEISYSDASLNFDWAYESGEENDPDREQEGSVCGTEGCVI